MKLYLTYLLLSTLIIVNSQISTISDTAVTIDSFIPLPVLFCKYDQTTGSCSGICGLKGQCCVFAFAQKLDGTPLCKCNAQPFCPKCQYNALTKYPCSDQANICSSSGSGSSCCTFQKLTGPIGTSGSYPLCYCQQNSNNCPTCSFNYQKGKCQDPTGLCSGDRCCQFTGINSLGKPTCTCTSQTQLCSNCQFINGVCLDPTQKCANGKCCQFKYDLGVKRCECNTCTSLPNNCRYNPQLFKCQDLSGLCKGDRCCTYAGIDSTGTPICNCTTDLKNCSTCQLVVQSLSNNSICYTCTDPTKTCIGANCCQLVAVSTSAYMCICKNCQSQPTCKWNSTSKICQDLSGTCKGQQCCRPSGKVLADGTPDCYCSNITLQGKCDNCMWANQKCFDPTGICTGNLCCIQKFFPNSHQFACRCNQCVSIDNCRYNPDLLSCQDPTQQCSGKNCCSYQGVDTTGKPICRCTADLTQCSYCQFFSYTPTSVLKCQDSTGKCTSNGNCCQLAQVSSSAQMCLCKNCVIDQPSCRWNPLIKSCYDYNSICSTGLCCRPTGQLSSDGTPFCFCSNFCISPV